MRDYRFPRCELALSPPVEVGYARGHFWFPSLHVWPGQGILCEVVFADDKAQGQWPGTLILTSDGGNTWRRVKDIPSYGPTSVALDRGRLLLLPYELWPLAPGDRRNATGPGTILGVDRKGGIATETAAVAFRGFPADLADYHEGEVYLVTNGNVLPLGDGRLFTTMYGRFVGDSKYRSFAVTSADGGREWQFLAVVADGEQTSANVEGPCESANVRLADGRLMSVYRVGSCRDYHFSLSADEGRTWTLAQPLAGVFSVEPQLVRLGNGAILLSGGREGLFLWVCPDGHGRNWQRLSLAEHHNVCLPDATVQFSEAFCRGDGHARPAESSSYTGLVAVGSDEALVCYDRLGNGWAGAPGPRGEFDRVFTVRVRVAV